MSHKLGLHWQRTHPDNKRDMWYNTGVINPIYSGRGAAQTAPGLSNSKGATVTMPHSTFNASATKTCTKCGETKPVAEFSKNRTNGDGLYSYCKPCASEKYRQWREANAERRRAYMQDWHRENLDHEREYKRRRYQSDDHYRRAVLDWQHNHRHNNLESVRMREREKSRKRDWRSLQVKARTTVNRAVRNGDLPPAWTMVCEECQEAQAAHWHHHEGYSKERRLDVVALCLDCHGKEHRVDD